MGLGVLETKDRNVPGTVLLSDNDKFEGLSTSVPESSSSLPNAALKRNKDGIILVPQPSDDPTDPLNLPLWRRDLITVILCLLSVIATTLSPLLAANTLTLALYFTRSTADIALLTGYHLLGVGLSGFIFVASARVWGKRHLYVIGTVIIILSSLWGGLSNENYNSLLAARFFQGVGLAPFEALVNSSVADLYFVHERGLRMALSNLSLFGGAFFTPVIVGRLTATLDWQWSFYLLAIFTTGMLPLVILFIPETAFRRDTTAAYATSETGRTSGSLNEADPGKEEHTTTTTTSAQPSYYVPKLFSKENIRLFNGKKTDESFFVLLFKSIPLFFHPGIFWACLIQGTLIGWTVFIGIVLAVILIIPPFIFSEDQVGYMYTGAFVGALLGFALAGLLSDPMAKWMTRRNGGIYEPEFRLILVIPQLIFGCAGLYGFGFVAADVRRYGWFWPDFFFALEVMGMVLGAVASALYIADAHADIAVEAFTCLLIFKNIFSFGLTYSGVDWLIQGGIRPMFIGVASVQVGICALTIFMYIFGKWNRAFFARHPVFDLNWLLRGIRNRYKSSRQDRAR